MNRALTGVLAAGILLAGGVAVATAPNGATVFAPFAVFAGADGTAAGRLVSVRVLDVRLATTITPDYGFEEPSTTTDGVWVVVDCVLTANEGYESMTNVELEVGGRTFQVSSVLPDPNLDVLEYGAGVPVQGVLVFEVPADAVTGAAASTARLVVNPNIDSRLDGVAVVTLDLAELDVEREAKLLAAFVPDAG